MKINPTQLLIGAAIGYALAKMMQQSGGVSVAGLRYPDNCNTACKPWPNNDDFIPFTYRWPGKLSDQRRMSNLTI